MSDAKTVAALQRNLAAAEVERLRLVERVAELEADFMKRQAAHCCPAWDDAQGDCDCDERMGRLVVANAELLADLDRKRTWADEQLDALHKRLTASQGALYVEIAAEREACAQLFSGRDGRARWTALGVQEIIRARGDV